MSTADLTTPHSFAAATRQKLAARRRRERIGNILLTIAGVIGLLVLWEVSVDLFKVPPYIVPSPERVFHALWSGLAVPIDSRVGFYMPLWNTLKHAALGFLIGASLGVILGSLMAEYRPFEIILMPYAFALQSLPKIAIAPLIIVWCGFGNGSKIVMAALLTFFPMLVNSFAGVRSTEAERIDLMKALSASRLQTYLRVKLPTAAPYIFAGLDMGVVYALLGTIVAEFLGAQEGIGVVITQAQAVTDVAGVFAALVILGAVGIALHLLIRFAERRIVHWSDRHK
jgi:NitT/TauT family transport system permease protein